MNPEQKAARAYLKRKMAAGGAGWGAMTLGLPRMRPRPPYTFEDAVRARAKVERLRDSLARSKGKGTA